MHLSKFLLTTLFFFSPIFTSTILADEFVCRKDVESLFEAEYELRQVQKKVLNNQISRGIALEWSNPYLSCMIDSLNTGNNMNQVLAKSILMRFFEQHNVADQDIYSFWGKELSERIKLQKKLFGKGFFLQVSKGVWRVYRPFCNQELKDVCMAFLRKNNEILSQSPLRASMSVFVMLRASKKLPKKEKALIQKQFFSLYEQVPKNNELLLKAVKEAIGEFEDIDLPLG